MIIKLSSKQEQTLAHSNEPIRIKRNGVVYYIEKYRDLPIHVSSWGGTEYTDITVLDSFNEPLH